jgi:hypothetical protein
MYLIVAVDSTTTTHEGTPSLADLQSAVGGYIEAIRLQSDDLSAVLWVNEEGKLRGLPVNVKATRLARLYGNIGEDTIVGAVAVSGPEDEDGEITGLPDEWPDSVVR